MIQFPQQYVTPERKNENFRRVYLQTDKNMTMMTIDLVGCVVLLGLSVVIMVWLSKYIIEHKSNSAIPGFLELVIYIMLLFNLVYALGVYFITGMDEGTYKSTEPSIYYCSLSYVGLHILIPLILLLMGIGTSKYMEALGLIILPALGELAVFIAIAYGFHSLYSKSAFILVPVHEI